MPDKKYIDTETALARLGGNKGLYEKLLVKFEDSVDMDAFNDAIESKDYTAAGDIAHAAKGVAGNLSLTAFFDQSVVVMDQLRDGNYSEDDVEEFNKLYGETTQAIDQMLND